MQKIENSSSALEHLFGSKTRVHLLYTFFNQPEKKFFVRELSRRIGVQINAIRRELEGLLKENFIVQIESENHKNSITDKKYFAINQNFILFPELKSLFAKSHLFLSKDLIDAIKGTNRVSLIILTGVFTGAKKTETDLMVVGSINRDKLRDVVRQFEVGLGFEINYTLMDEEEYKYRKDISDRFIGRIFEEKYIVAQGNT